MLSIEYAHQLDRIRAEFAMSTRRLEMSIKGFREKAAAQVIEINRNREELKQLAAERGEKDRALSQIEAKGSELRAELRISLGRAITNEPHPPTRNTMISMLEHLEELEAAAVAPRPARRRRRR